ncbi:diguanylate cyclase domain-containing protein [Cupriavidus necator]|uniref:diguanylate cyclase domain-containing protein n=1 Tax=Cupriavidus necator TaxID=106590 RepID=UPI003F73E739
MFQRIGNSTLALVDYFSAADLLLRTALHLSAVLAASALALALLMWVTLQGIGKLFSHCLARGEALRALPETDALTGLTNRREFEARFGIEYEHCLRDKTPMSMLMIDIDRFKRINDNWGHASGERGLRKLASVIALNFGRNFGAPGWDRTSNPCLRSFGDEPKGFINQCLVQLATCKTKAKQGQSRPIQHAIGAI